MEKRDTQKIVEELKLCPDFKTFYDENRQYMVDASLSDMLCELMEKKGLKKTDVIHNSELSEVYAYQILSGIRIPERKKLLCIAIAMGLTLDEVQNVLQCAGYAPLYVRLPFDSVLLYGICQKMSVMDINGLLFEYGLETLG